jgi:hypothetical protein
LENVLVGPGDLVWLIDFAATREGHALFDFARLEAELTTQVVAPLLLRHGLGLPDFFQVFEGLERGINPGGGPRGEIHEFLATLRRVGRRCLFDPAEGREFLQALILAYLGTLKFSNLDDLEEAPFPKQLSFAAAGYLLALEGGI